MAEHTAAHWLTAWQQLALPAVAIQTHRDLASDEDAWANDYLLDADWARAGSDGRGIIRGLPIGLSKSPCKVTSAGPGLGDDSLPIITDLLEYDDEKLAAVLVSNAVNSVE